MKLQRLVGRAGDVGQRSLRPQPVVARRRASQSELNGL